MSELFLKIVNMSISASYLVAAVLLLRLVLKKAPKWVSVLLWGMVAIRLICPISIESVLSLIPSTQTVSPEIMMDRTPEVSTGIPAVDTVVNPVITETFAPEPVASANPLQILIPVSANLWLLGVLVMLGYTAVSYLMLRRKLATAVRLKNNIYQCENVDSPFVLGMVRPRIYLPFRMDGKNLNHVIAHEEAHIRRKDHWWKPMGFVLLAIHWFNPLMWVGYILLCRDIELACDEKVIKEMDNETKADYMQALVSCSVNRRSIAACPLAFGEVGVKERVKTMMNYKKPAFWIVIAAVALCIVVAVSFLTNPKGYGPKVGNPKMLELPGVEWFVTPEELKEALNITEDQILGEKTQPTRENVATNYDRYWLYVTDITLYGRDVTYAQFEFRRDPGHDFEFVQVFVTFADDTDMDALKADLTDIYGLGSSEPYSYYLVEDDRTREYSAKMNLEQQMEYLAHTYKSEDGNPYMEALEDPEYMVHHWVTENGCDLIPEEVVEWFKYVMDRPWNADKTTLQDDKVLMDMLDQFPWVAMTLSNRNAAAIRRDTQGTESEFASYYSNNYLEISASMLANYLHKEDQMPNPSLLEFPGLKWNSTITEVKKALNLKEEQILFDEMLEYEGAEYDTWGLVATGTRFFDFEVEKARFTFIRYPGNDYGLLNISLSFSGETDMNKLKEEMVEVYGSGSTESAPSYFINEEGHLEEVDRDSLVKVTGTEEGYPHYWYSTVTGIDALSAAALERHIDHTLTLNAGINQETMREGLLDYLKKTSVVQVSCTDWTTEKSSSVTFYANMLVHNLQQFEE